MCIAPITLVRKDKALTVNGSMTNIVPCGKCPECLRKRANSWAFRIYQELKHVESAKFITLTYENTPMTRNGLETLRKKDIQTFMKRIRKGTLNRLKYYVCGEYGTETERPHYHILLLNIPYLWTLDPKYIENYWQHGRIHIGEANIRTIHYTLKYMMKGTFRPTHELDDREPVFSLMSKGLGIKYLTEEMKAFLKSHLDGYITLNGGIKQAMPRYLKEKGFTHLEKLIIRHKQQNRALAEPVKDSITQITTYHDKIRKAERENRKRNKL